MTDPARVRRPLFGVLAADIISTTGTEMTTVALPWLVLVTTGSPTRTGGVLAAEYFGLTVLGLVGGRLTTALGPRRLMLVADAVRAVLIGLVPLQYALGGLSYPLLLAVAFAVGGFFPAYQSSQRLVVTGLLGADEVRLTRFNGLNNAVNESASFLGPALGGVLVALLGAPGVLLLDAGSYLLSFVLVAGLIPGPTGPVSTEDDGSVRAGVRYLWRHPRLRGEVTGLAVMGIAWAAMTASLPVLALRAGGGPTAAGWLLGAYGAGSVLGGLISTRARAETRTATFAIWGIAAAQAGLVLQGPLWIDGALVGLVGVGSGLYYPRFFAGVMAGTPPAIRATVLATVTIVLSAPGPVGYVGAGLLNQYAAGLAAGLVLVGGAGIIGAVLVTIARTGGQVATRTDAVES